MGGNQRQNLHAGKEEPAHHHTHGHNGQAVGIACKSAGLNKKLGQEQEGPARKLPSLLGDLTASAAASTDLLPPRTLVLGVQPAKPDEGGPALHSGGRKLLVMKHYDL